MQSVARGLSVLRALAEEGEPLRLADVQRKTGLQKTVAHRLLKTLVEARFVEQDADSGRFHIGIGALEVALAYPHAGSLVELSRRHMRALVEGSPHTAYLAALDGFEIVYLTVVEGTGPLRVHVTPGNRIPAYATAVGKALLAELDDQEIAHRADAHGFVSLTSSTITRTPELLEAVARIRADGYALNREEAYPGIGAVAAVVPDGSGKATVGITLSYATSLLSDEELPSWIERTTTTVLEIAAAAGTIAVDRTAEAR
ncbi:MAG TPA: IclR family transcriptional regulator [Gaiellaceae bacterium]|nr:IclR family transcriptional regulator [Gaiellaceae bacterium]